MWSGHSPCSWVAEPGPALQSSPEDWLIGSSGETVEAREAPEPVGSTRDLVHSWEARTLGGQLLCWVAKGTWLG